MVHLCKVSHFVRGDVIENFGRRENQPPREHEIALRGTGTPTRPCIAQNQPRIWPPQPHRVPVTCRRETIARPNFQPSLQSRPHRPFRHAKCLILQNNPTPVDMQDFPENSVYGERNARPNAHVFFAPVEMSENPVLLLSRKIERFGFRRAIGQGQRHTTVKLRYAQRYPPCPGGTPHHDWHARHAWQMMFAQDGPPNMFKGFDSTYVIWQATGIVDMTRCNFKGTPMPKEEWGTKRVCPTTGKRFYDLNQNPIVSPYTGEVVEVDNAKARMIAADAEDAATAKSKKAMENDDEVVLDDDDVDVDLGDDLLEDEDDDDDVSLDEIADVASDDDD